jgi:inner membrane protein
MSTIITHTAVPLAIGIGLGSRIIPPRLLFAGVIFSILPDIDVIGFFNGIPYHSSYGHRGFTHSIGFAVVCAFVAVLFARNLKSGAVATFLFLAVAMASHGIMDAMTHGGLGVGLAWPVTDERYFLPWRPLPVPAIGIRYFFSNWGFYVIKAEFIKVWLPMLYCIAALWLVRFSVFSLGNRNSPARMR